MTTRVVLLAFALVACQCDPKPAPRALPADTSTVRVVPDEAGAPLDVGCPGECSNLARLKCRWYSPTCVANCEAAKAALARFGSTLNTACPATADTCERAFECR